jgi:hypothetical protein
MASSRHSRSSSRRPAPAAKAPPEEADDVSVELPEGAGTFAEEAYEPGEESGAAPALDERAPSSARGKAAGRSSASRASGRSSRRIAATSDKKSARRVVSPEESRARRRALLSALKLALGLIILVGGSFAVYWFLIRDDPRVLKAKAVLSDIDTMHIRYIDTALDHQKPDEAEKSLIEARKKLEDTPEFGDPKLVEVLGPPTTAAKDRLAEREKRIARVKRDVRVIGNLDTLLGQFAHLNEPETNLDTLEADAKAFLDNPVEWPKGSHNEDYIKTYSTEVNRIATRMSSIQSERTRRLADDTTKPVENVRTLAKGLIAQEKYHEALAAVDDAAAKHPNANFAEVRAWIEDDAEKNWVADKSVVENLYKDVDAIGSSAATRKEALEKARARLHHVIDNYGIDKYIEQAKALLAQYPE